MAHVDELVAAGVIGGDEPNAADLQIGSSLQVLSTLDDLDPLLKHRPAQALGQRHFSDLLRGSSPAAALPATWLPNVHAAPTEGVRMESGAQT